MFEVASFDIEYNCILERLFPPKVYDSHPHYLCHDEDAWTQGSDHHQVRSTRCSSM
jgi:hypothetical protein